MTGPRKISECFALQYNTKQLRKFFLLYCNNITNMPGHFLYKG